MTKESFRDWKANPVTKAVFNDMTVRIFRLQEELSGTAGLNPLHDRFLVGAINAYRDILNIEFEEVPNGD